MQLVWLWPALGRLGLRPRLRLGFGHAEVRKVGRLMLPTLFSSSVAQVNLLVGTAFAALLVDGSVECLYYSDRLVEFPSACFGSRLAPFTCRLCPPTTPPKTRPGPTPPLPGSLPMPCCPAPRRGLAL